jgi:hypothetical protein
MIGDTNFYKPLRKGFFIYYRERGSRWIAQRKYPQGYSKCALFYELEDARKWLDIIVELEGGELPQRDE